MEEKVEKKEKKTKETPQEKPAKKAPEKKSDKEKKEASSDSKDAKTEVKTPKKKKEKRIVPTGCVHIQATFNNTIITVSDSSGNVVGWSSSGSHGFRGSKKSTPFAAQIASETACKKAYENGMRSVEVHIKGPGAGREAALRAVQGAGLKVTLIKDVTPIPHNGCRPPKRRRV